MITSCPKTGPGAVAAPAGTAAAAAAPASTRADKINGVRRTRTTSSSQGQVLLPSGPASRHLPAGRSQCRNRNIPALGCAERNMTYPVQKTDEQWRQELTPEEYSVLRKAGTERPWTGEYNETKTEGVYS